MKFIAASIVFMLFMKFMDMAVDKVRIDYKDHFDKNWVDAKRLKTFSRFIGFFGLMSIFCFFASIIYVILK